MEPRLNNFKGSITQEVIEYVRQKYDISPEFPWENSPCSAVLRNKDNGKWFGIIMGNLPRTRLGLEDFEKCEIINLKCDPLFISLTVDGKGYFRAYHMNKENWISVLLDGTVPIEEILKIIDMSYEIINRSKKRSKQNGL